MYWDALLMVLDFYCKEWVNGCIVYLLYIQKTIWILRDNVTLKLPQGSTALTAKGATS